MELTGAILLLIGSIVCLIAAVGILRFPDQLTRLQAAAKVAALGSGICLLGSALMLDEARLIVRFLVLFVFIFATAAIVSHLLARAAYLDGVPLWRATAIDELARRARLESSDPERQMQTLEDEIGR